MRGYAGKCLKSGPDQDKIGDSIEREEVLFFSFSFFFFLSAAAERKLKWWSYLCEPDAEPNPAETTRLNGSLGCDEDQRNSDATCGQVIQKHYAFIHMKNGGLEERADHIKPAL